MPNNKPPNSPQAGLERTEKPPSRRKFLKWLFVPTLVGIDVARVVWVADIEPNDITSVEDAKLREVLDTFFASMLSSEAKAAIKGVPLKFGERRGGTAAAFFEAYWIKDINIDLEAMPDYKRFCLVTLHEAVHALDEEFIDHKAFKKAFKALSLKSEFSEICAKVDEFASAGGSYWKECLAFFAIMMVARHKTSFPEVMKTCFKDFFHPDFLDSAKSRSDLVTKAMIEVRDSLKDLPQDSSFHSVDWS